MFEDMFFYLNIHGFYRYAFYFLLLFLAFFILKFTYRFLRYYYNIAYDFYIWIFDEKIIKTFNNSLIFDIVVEYLRDFYFFLLVKYLILTLVCSYVFSFIPIFGSFFTKFFSSIIVILGVLIIRYVFDMFLAIYNTYDFAKKRPIRGYLQLLMIFVYFISLLFIVSIILDRSLWALFASLGAIAAVLVIVFRDSLLGLFASFQISSNKILKIGDWIEMPDCGANGEVIEITLHVVKVRNWDNTLVFIPAYKIISNSFKQWTSMKQSGARRIKLRIYIDVNSIKLCGDSFLQRMDNNLFFDNLYPLIGNIQKPSSNTLNDYLNSTSNLTIFRLYILFYLKNHTKISYSPVSKNNIKILVRILSSEGNGIPIEIYAFSKEIDWVKYETLQSEIFEHLFSIVSVFELKIFQNYSDYDLKF